MLELWAPRRPVQVDRAEPRLPWFPDAWIVSDRQPSPRRSGEILEALEQVIAARKGESPDRSYTSRLLAGGVPKIAGKVTEEAGELVQAAADETDDRVVSEAADLVYHMLVLLACRGVPLARVEDELARRFGVSGLDEKASRSATGGHTTGGGR
jgi:phosphoribosyl-ATP pyrophosphohydrolase